MTKTKILRIWPAVQQGFTLVELMVSVTISLVLVLFVSSLFISSKGSYRLNDDNARLQEDGRYAMALIGRNLMQAGYGNPKARTTTDLESKVEDVDADGKRRPLPGLIGCDNGFADPVENALTPACAATGKPGFQVSYRMSAPEFPPQVPVSYDANTGEGADCNGQNIVNPKTPLQSEYIVGIAVNRFYLVTKGGVSSLYCYGNGGTVSQPVLSNVEEMVLTYELKTGDTINYGKNIVIDKSNWEKVVSVQVCLLLSSANNVTPQAQTYNDCNGTPQTATDRKLRTAMTSVFALRNNVPQSLE